MSDAVVRLFFVLAVIAAALMIAAIATRVKKPVHPAITVGDVGDRPGVVLFTSTDCGTCKEAIALLESESIPFREVTYDLEPHRFDTWTVFAVPLTVVIDAEGEILQTMTGVPALRKLRRAVAAARIARS